ncbi:hypothetical protein HYH03_014593 [Edaphochlamys debaryana]|uniref:Uncharacterized protein n=1 Tax=Edaphochlamys debaryana TaxID=47281 RepID=A0A835XNI7_9CHLO|nr:hypothetical protein HYH03_014593 [Edaphochlamys debaryana]|eukprot:KAG2486794.1 hypothetical protein HYH03_014593 [Edaphochlamys debaryana]
MQVSGQVVEPCAGVWVVPSTGQVAVCIGPTYLQLPPVFPKCPLSQAVECDPCASATCEAFPTATCVPNKCAVGRTYQGASAPPCGALFVNDAKDVVDCTPISAPHLPRALLATLGRGPSPTPSLLTPPLAPPPAGVRSLGSPLALCIRGAYEACLGATCPAHPTAQCVVKACETVFRGITLPACTPVWYDPATGEVVQCPQQPKHRRQLLRAAA